MGQHKIVHVYILFEIVICTNKYALKFKKCKIKIEKYEKRNLDQRIFIFILDRYCLVYAWTSRL